MVWFPCARSASSPCPVLRMWCPRTISAETSQTFDQFAAAGGPAFATQGVAMATPSLLEDAPTPQHESLAARLVRLGSLELELGWAETRRLLLRVAIAAA